MANTLDLQEQEQLDDLKAFWKRWGHWVTALITLLALAYAGYNLWTWYQRDQAVKAAAVFDELDKAAAAGDAERSARVFADLKDRYAGTAYAEQGGLLVARVQLDKGQADAARATLSWVAEHALEAEYRAIARLRLAGLLLDRKQYAEALQQLDQTQGAHFAPLVADRRGDVLLAQGRKAEAVQAYQTAWAGLNAQLDYRRLVEAKLTALGRPPASASASAAAAAPEQATTATAAATAAPTVAAGASR